MIDFSSNLPDISFQEKLKIQLESIKNWEQLSELDKEYEIEKFMDSLGKLFLEYFQFHLSEAKDISTQFSKELSITVRPINLYYVYKLNARLRSSNDWMDLWETVCWAATNIEAYAAMFSDHVCQLDDEYIWEYMEERKDKEHLESHQIPKNVPKSHWWWFADYRPNWKW